MKKITQILLLLSVVFTGCVGNDFIEDRIEERISIDNPIDEIQVNDTYQMMATFFNNVGQSEIVSLSWSSSDNSIATIDDNGLLRAISLGEVTISISVEVDGNMINEDRSIRVITEIVNDNDPIAKMGTIITTSSYVLTGDFSISEIIASQNLDIQVAENYAASSSLPGLYLYLSNNPNSISDALEVGPVSVFNGAHAYEIENTGINEYKYLLYWCKPFSVKVGHGEIEE